jgi:hypothetical protein
MKPRIVPRTPASSGVGHPSSSRSSESARVISVVMALSPSAAANRRFGFRFKPEITPPPIPTNPGTAPPLFQLAGRCGRNQRLRMLAHVDAV